jgi:putative ATP-binding cassette transporter
VTFAFAGLGSKSTALRVAWTIARPYWISEDRWAARGLLAVIVALNLGTVGLLVALNAWNARFYDALQAKDEAAFFQELGVFVALAVVYILLAVYALYLNQMLQIRWRRWLTDRFLDRWLAARAYYRLELAADGADNPDQRIAEDLKLFVADSLTLSLGLLREAVTLASFLGILWSLSGDLAIPGTDLVLPGYMVWVALVYAVLGTWLTHRIGRPLVGLNFEQQRFEADFRFGLVRLRENAEAVALYRGEAGEADALRGRFKALMANWWAIMRRQKHLTFFTVGYAQAASVFPILVAAPRYFAGEIQLGGLMQTASAFGQVQGALSWVIEAYVRLTEWSATVTRLGGLLAALDAAEAAGGGLATIEDGGDRLELADLTLRLPDGRQLLDRASLVIRRGDRVMITGPSGGGKSTLFRAIAGIWPWAEGRLIRPGGRALFLPQRPYLPLGDLRRAVCYPGDPAAFTDEAMAAALTAVDLAPLARRLDETDNWSRRLSPGEQQRLAIVRVLLARPDWLFLDEATAALDPEREAALHRLILDRLPEVTLVSIAHRPELAAFHDRHVAIDPQTGRLVEPPDG